MEAPREIPEMYKDDFTLMGKIQVDEWYFNQAYLGKSALSPIWTNKVVLAEMEKARMRENFKYGDDTI